MLHARALSIPDPKSLVTFAFLLFFVVFFAFLSKFAFFVNAGRLRQ